MKNRTIEIIVVSVILLAIMIPFLEKPFQADDVFYLEITKAIVKDPFRPFSFMINWGNVPSSGFGVLNPPLFSYALAPVWAKWGASEVPLHLVALLFVFSAVISFYFLCSELNIKPFIPTLVFLSVPFLAVGTNLMLDTPVLGLAIPAVLFFVTGVKRNKAWLLVLSGVLLSLAVLTKYSALALLVPFFIHPFIVKKPRFIIPFVIGLAVFLLWNIYCLYVYGKPHFMNSHLVNEHFMDMMSISLTLLFNPLTFFMVIGMTLPYAFLVVRRGSAFYFSLICGLETALFSFLLRNKDIESFINACLVGTGVFLGLYLLIYVFSHIKLKKKGLFFVVLNEPVFIFMALWIMMIMIMILFFTPNIAVRNVVFMYPPLIILMFGYTPFSAVAEKKIYTVVCIMLSIHFALAYADFKYAQTYKDAAPRLMEIYKNRTVWYLGHYGWQHYADKAGFHQWSKLNDRTAKGDIVIIPQHVFKQRITDELKDKIKKVNSLTYELSWQPIRSHGTLSHGGFYTSVLTYPTYSLSCKPLEVIDIYEVMK